MNPIYLQFNCMEGDKPDLRQAKAILRHKPDIIIFETPQGPRGPNTIFNRCPCARKPMERVDAIIAQLHIAAQKYPYAKGDIEVWKNITLLWEKGENVQIYNIDAPDALRREFFFALHSLGGYPKSRKDWLFWVYLYLREAYMEKNMRWILAHYTQKPDPVVLVFLQSIHWEHTLFRLGDPSRSVLWNFYFSRFPDKNPSNIVAEIRKRSVVFHRFWKKISTV